MSRRANPVGVRVGILPPGEVSVVASYGRGRDLHGWSSRWTEPHDGRAGDLQQRDNRIRQRVTEWLRREGYIVNKCIVTRCSSYVQVYVDGYRREEPRRLLGAYDRSRSLEATRGEGGSGEVAGVALLEDTLSEVLEGGQPVRIRFSCLNELLSEVVADGEWEERAEGVVGGWYRWDLRQRTQLLGVVPSVRVWVTARTHRLSGSLGKNPRDRVRTVRGSVQLLEHQVQGERGLWDPHREEGVETAAGTPWDIGKLVRRRWGGELPLERTAGRGRARVTQSVQGEDFGWTWQVAGRETTERSVGVTKQALEARLRREGVLETSAEEVAVETVLEPDWPQEVSLAFDGESVRSRDGRVAPVWSRLVRGREPQEGRSQQVSVDHVSRRDRREREGEEAVPEGFDRWRSTRDLSRAEQPEGEDEAPIGLEEEPEVERGRNDVLGFRGLRRERKGRVGGSEQKKTFRRSVGTLSRQTLTSARDYASQTADTKGGAVEVRRRVTYGGDR